MHTIFHEEMKKLRRMFRYYFKMNTSEIHRLFAKIIYISVNNFILNLLNISLAIFMWSRLSRKRTIFHGISAFYCLKKCFGSTTSFNGFYWGSTLSITSNKSRLTLKLSDMDLDCRIKHFEQVHILNKALSCITSNPLFLWKYKSSNNY